MGDRLAGWAMDALWCIVTLALEFLDLSPDGGDLDDGCVSSVACLSYALEVSQWGLGGGLYIPGVSCGLHTIFRVATL